MLSLLLTEELSKHLRVVQCTTNTFLITFFSYLILISHFVQTLLALSAQQRGSADMGKVYISTLTGFSVIPGKHKHREID